MDEINPGATQANAIAISAPTARMLEICPCIVCKIEKPTAAVKPE